MAEEYQKQYSGLPTGICHKLAIKRLMTGVYLFTLICQLLCVAKVDAQDASPPVVAKENVKDLGDANPLSPNRAAELANQLPPWPDLSLPKTKDHAKLMKFATMVKELTPTNGRQFLEMQTALRGVSKLLIGVIEDRQSEAFQTAEFDFISSSVNMLANQGKDAQEKTFKKIRDYLNAKKELTMNDLQMSMIAAANIEQLADRETAINAYETYADLIEAKKEPTHLMFVETLRSNVTRLRLPGKKIELTGTTITGDKFDLKQLEGKYVVINVWASWAPTASAEYPYLKTLYETYREKGFEIVGISLDSDKAELLKFVREKEVPWVNLWAENQHPFAAEYGISTLPTMILIEPDGKVATLEARGVILGNALANIFKAEDTGDAALGIASGDSNMPAAVPANIESNTTNEDDG